MFLLALFIFPSCSPIMSKGMKKAMAKTGRGCIASIRSTDFYYKADGSIDSSRSDLNKYYLDSFDYKNNTILSFEVTGNESKMVEMQKFGRFGKEEFYLDLYGNIFHTKYYYNKDGLLIKENSVDTTKSSYHKTHYFYDNKKRLVKSLTYDKNGIAKDSTLIQYSSGGNVTTTLNFRSMTGNDYISKTISNAKTGIDTIYNNTLYSNNFTVRRVDKKASKSYEDVYSNGKLKSSILRVLNRQGEVLLAETTYPDREKKINRNEYTRDKKGNVIQLNLYTDGRLTAQYFETYRYCGD